MNENQTPTETDGKETKPSEDQLKPESSNQESGGGETKEKSKLYFQSLKGPVKQLMVDVPGQLPGPESQSSGASTKSAGEQEVSGEKTKSDLTAQGIEENTVGEGTKGDLEENSKKILKMSEVLCINAVL